MQVFRTCALCVLEQHGENKDATRVIVYFPQTLLLRERSGSNIYHWHAWALFLCYKLISIVTDQRTRSTEINV